ncbi:MAG: peptide transporter ATP-binding protein [Pseudarthrobacter sp.]|nr:peptide transporter ATP-binding protein [Pseudarthrobacter sp.]
MTETAALNAAESAPARDGLLRVENLVVDYAGKGFRAKKFRALTDINISIGQGETLGLVGESGSGKTTLGRAVLGLAPVSGGRITFEGKAHRLRRAGQCAGPVHPGAGPGSFPADPERHRRFLPVCLPRP